MAKILFPAVFLLSFALSANDTCPPYAHTETLPGSRSSLPDGFYVYGVYYRNGIHISKMKAHNPYIVRGTQNDCPENICLSDNGQWVLYTGAGIVYVVRLADGYKATVAVSVDSVAYACFYRNSPYGSEICYMVSDSIIRAVRVDLSSAAPAFGADRILADMHDKANIIPGVRLSVCKDQILAPIFPLHNGEYIWRTGFLTIPDGGTGVAGPDNLYKWKDDAYKPLGGCGHTISFDGTLCAADYGDMTASLCAPHYHKGFSVTPFWRNADSAVTVAATIDSFALSTNWCPEQYRYGSAGEMNFWDWYFSNSNRYIIGMLRGDRAPIKGLWMIEWETNAWTFLSDTNEQLDIYQPAVCFCNPDTVLTDSTFLPITANPADTPALTNAGYRVVSPNGGELYYQGNTMNIVVHSDVTACAVVKLSVDGGLTSVEIGNAFNPRTDSVMQYEIPESLLVAQEANTQPQQVSTVSSQCLIIFEDYGNEMKRSDKSDSFFSIRPPESTPQNTCGCGAGAGLACIPALLILTRKRAPLRKKSRKKR